MKYWIPELCLMILSCCLAAAPAEFRTADRRYVVEVVDGMSGRALDGKLESGVWRGKGGFTISFRERREGELTFCDLKFFTPESDTSSLRRLSVVCSTECHEPDFFYDGNSLRKWGGKTLERKQLLDTFPLAAAYGGNGGKAIGISPASVVGYLHSRLSRENGKSKLSYTTHVVADSRKVQEVSFIAFPFVPEFGWNNALELYYLAYPAYFRPHPGVDKRISGIMGYFLSAHKSRDLEINSGRQFHLDLEWTYAPWVESGNWYTGREDWIQGIHECTNYDALRKHRKCTWEEYHEARVRQFRSGDRQAAMFYYILPRAINMKYGRLFPDAVFVDSLGRRQEGGGLSQIASEAGKATTVFAYGSGLSAVLEKELAEVVENYKVSGFSFDMVNFHSNEYNKAQLNFATGRDFDRNGKIFTPDSVVPIPFVNYIHTLKRDGKTMGVFANFAFNRIVAHTAFAVDGAMVECSPDIACDAFKTLRIMAGQKPLSFFGSFDQKFRNKAIKWDMVQTPQKRKELSFGLAQYMLFCCLRYGYTPMNWSFEYRDRTFFEPWLKIMLQLKKKGWRPVPAVKWVPADAELWCGRFGEGRESMFTLTNPTRGKIDVKATVIKSYLGKGEFEPYAVTGQKIEFRDTGKTIEFEIAMEPKEILVIAMKGAEREPEATLLSDRKKIQSFFGLSDAQQGTVAVVAPDDEAKILYDFIDRYYPYVQASREFHKKPFCREPGFLNAKYNDIWRLPLRRKLESGRQIVIGTLAQFPRLAAKLTPQENALILRNKGGFVKLFPEENILWIGGAGNMETRMGAMLYLELLDEKEKLL